MFSLLLFAQIAVATPVGVPDTATYSSAAVRTLVTEAAGINRLVPAGLGGYHAQVETEITFGTHDASGKEIALSLEQIASDIAWNRTGAFTQRVTGYRTQMPMGLASISGLFRDSWVVPSLYGNRISLFWGRDTTRYGRRQEERPVAASAVHPLADDRERYYRFSGGDTVEAITIDRRIIHIVRVDVDLRDDIPANTLVFAGEIDFDVDRRHIVRMRGAFYRGEGTPRETIGFAAVHALYLIELVNSEVDRQFWLPEYQRLEVEAEAPVIGDSKIVDRVVSHMRYFRITPPDPATPPAGDTLRAFAHTLTFAPHDSLGAFRDWQFDLGAATSTLNVDDFDDVGPANWRADGRPEIAIRGERVTDLLRFDRVEGFFTGLGVSAQMRDAAPGVTLRALGGYAWSEETVRGRVSAELRRGDWAYTLRAGRSLDITNDFRAPLDSGSSIGALVGADDYDYVDRYSAGVSVTRSLDTHTALVRVEAGWADDRAVTDHLTLSPVGRTIYRPNRGIDPGSYFRTAATVEWHSGTLGEGFLRPGIGASLSYLRGDGELNFQRADVRVQALQNIGPWRFASHLDAGVVGGAPPPQQLFELGGDQSLPGADYKQYAGDRAALLSGFVMYRLPLLRGPLVLSPRIIIPGPSPSLFVSAQGGWAGASSDAVRAAIARLGTMAVSDTGSLTLYAPVSTPMANAVGSVGGGLTVFEGAFGVGAARTLDRDAKWKVRMAFGLYF